MSYIYLIFRKPHSQVGTPKTIVGTNEEESNKAQLYAWTLDKDLADNLVGSRVPSSMIVEPFEADSRVGRLMQDNMIRLMVKAFTVPSFSNHVLYAPLEEIQQHMENDQQVKIIW